MQGLRALHLVSPHAESGADANQGWVPASIVEFRVAAAHQRCALRRVRPKEAERCLVWLCLRESPTIQRQAFDCPGPPGCSFPWSRTPWWARTVESLPLNCRRFSKAKPNEAAFRLFGTDTPESASLMCCSNSELHARTAYPRL